MTISERIIKVLKERNMTQAEFAKQVGIATSTIRAARGAFAKWTIKRE